LKSPFLVTVERIIPGGRGLAFYDGRPVFIPHSVPGDRVLVREFKDRRSYLEAQSVEIVDASLDRTSPPCCYFGTCGGCDFQHMIYERQLASKREILVDALKHVGKICLPASQISVVPSPPLAYRNRVQLKVSCADQDFAWGFFQTASHRVCSVGDCLIASKPLWSFQSSLRRIIENSSFQKRLVGLEIVQGDDNQFLVELQFESETPNLVTLRQELQAQRFEPGEARVSLFVSQSSGRPLKVSGDGYVWKTVGGLKYRVSNGSFFQVNEPMLEKLRDCATVGLSGKVALELFCGVGFFTMALAKNFAEVFAVEANPPSAKDFRANMTRNLVGNCTLISQDVRSCLRGRDSLWKGLDLIFMDPPRTGLPPDLVNEIAALGSEQLVYVSCDPSTLARDLRLLLNHQYQICSLALLDLFPQTHHLETVAKLRRTS
jgi:23S rRNA (uracil1939-C5)-methyltransferase